MRPKRGRAEGARSGAREAARLGEGRGERREAGGGVAVPRARTESPSQGSRALFSLFSRFLRFGKLQCILFKFIDLWQFLEKFFSGNTTPSPAKFATFEKFTGDGAVFPNLQNSSLIYSASSGRRGSRRGRRTERSGPTSTSAGCRELYVLRTPVNNFE